MMTWCWAWAGFALTAGVPAPQAPLLGYWEGTILVPQSPLPVRLTFREEAGQLVAWLGVPAQQVRDLPAQTVTYRDGTLRVEFRTLGATWQGRYVPPPATPPRNDPPGNRDELRGELRGTWSQSGLNLPCDWKPVTAFTEARRPQQPKPPFPYDAREVRVLNPLTQKHLAGTLTFPRTKPLGGPIPAVILVSGSGPQDRNSTFFDHQPFLVLADHLTRANIAVLRYDDRGVGQSEGSHASATTEDLGTDAAAMLRWLRQQPGIDPRRVGVIGHSEGGLIGPIVAAKHPEEVGFLILLAGPGLPGAEILLDQNLQRFTTAEDQAAARILFGKLFEILRGTERRSVRRRLALEYLQQQATLSPPNVRQTLQLDDETQREALVAGLLSPWMEGFLRSDPAPILKQVRCPVLAVNGDKDVQVRAEANLRGIEQALAARPNGPPATVEVIRRPGLNHLFQPATTGEVSEYNQIETTFDAETLQILSRWIQSLPKEPK